MVGIFNFSVCSVFSVGDYSFSSAGPPLALEEVEAGACAFVRRVMQGERVSSNHGFNSISRIIMRVFQTAPYISESLPKLLRERWLQRCRGPGTRTGMEPSGKRPRCRRNNGKCFAIGFPVRCFLGGSPGGITKQFNPQVGHTGTTTGEPWEL